MMECIIGGFEGRDFHKVLTRHDFDDSEFYSYEDFNYDYALAWEDDSGRIVALDVYAVEEDELGVECAFFNNRISGEQLDDYIIREVTDENDDSITFTIQDDGDLSEQYHQVELLLNQIRNNNILPEFKTLSMDFKDNHEKILNEYDKYMDYGEEYTKYLKGILIQSSWGTVKSHYGSDENTLDSNYFAFRTVENALGNREGAISEEIASDYAEGFKNLYERSSHVESAIDLDLDDELAF